MKHQELNAESFICCWLSSCVRHTEFLNVWFNGTSQEPKGTAWLGCRVIHGLMSWSKVRDQTWAVSAKLQGREGLRGERRSHGHSCLFLVRVIGSARDYVGLLLCVAFQCFILWFNCSKGNKKKLPGWISFFTKDTMWRIFIVLNILT